GGRSPAAVHPARGPAPRSRLAPSHWCRRQAVPQRLLPDLAFSPDQTVRIVFDRDADGSRRAVIDLANGGKCVVYAAEEFWEQALDDAHRVNDSDFLRSEGPKKVVSIAPPVSAPTFSS